MEEYIFALIAFVLLLPVLYFMPGEISRKGKVLIAGGGLLISLLGLLANNQYPLLLVAIILFILVLVSSVMIGNRFGPLLLAEEGVQDRNSNAGADGEEERTERILFTATEEQQEFAQSHLEEKQEIAPEASLAQSGNETKVEFINEDLEEIPLLTDAESTLGDSSEEAFMPEVEENSRQYSEDKEESIEEEASPQHPDEEELSEIEMLIQHEKWEGSESVHITEQDETNVSSDEPLEELTLTASIEDSELDDESQENEELSEIELLIDRADETDQSDLDIEDEILSEGTSPLKVVEEPGVEEELSEIEAMIDRTNDETAQSHLKLQEGTLPEDTNQPEAVKEPEETALGELSEIEAEFLMTGQTVDDTDSFIEELTTLEEEIEETRETMEEEIEEEDMTEIKTASEEVSEETSEVLLSEAPLKQGHQQEEEQDSVLLEAAEMQAASEKSNLNPVDESIGDETFADQEPQKKDQLQTMVIHTIAEELSYFRNKMSLAEFEELAGQYLHPDLHDRDYYVLSQQLIQRYHESKEYRKMKVFIEKLEDRFMSYHALKSELNDYKEIAWKNIIKQEMLHGRE
ncbi:MAG: hypothetical protein ACQEUT_03735 [Bacillota bacterium]